MKLPDFLPAPLRKSLRAQGIRNAHDAAEYALLNPKLAARLGGDAFRTVVELVDDRTRTEIRSHRAPAVSLGVAGRFAPDSGRRARRVSQTGQSNGERIAAFLDRIRHAIPHEFSLLAWQSPVRSQGKIGSCTGWGSTAAREMLRRLSRTVGPIGDTTFSARFAYELAKQRDGFQGEGSWQKFVFDGMQEIGCIPESEFPYSDSPGRLATAHLHRRAARFRIPGYIDLLQRGRWAPLNPDIIRATISGFVTGGPQAVAVSLGVTSEWKSPSATSRGWIFVPEADAAPFGGHALTAIGYYWDAVIGQYVFVLKNSWGTDWASKNPIAAGCALVPENYFKREELVWEMLTPSAEPSPVNALGVLGSIIRRGWQSRSSAA